MRRLIITLSLATLPILAAAQDDFNRLKIDAEVRVDHTTALGFTGNSLNLAIEGKLSSDLSFHFKHRFNKANGLKRNFDATDWAYLDFKIDDRFTLSAGKQVVCLGGMEYHTSPVDMYFNSLFWSDMPCYKFGTSLSYLFATDRDLLTFQVCQSPYGLENKTYAYNLLLEDNHERYTGKHSISAMEYTRGQFFGILASGNEFRTDKCALQMDATFRYGSDHCDLISDFTLAGKFTYELDRGLYAFTKSVFDMNGSMSDLDSVICRETHVFAEGLGLEYYPERYHNNLRLHIVFHHRQGTYAYTAGDTIQTTALNDNIFNIGLTWKFNFIKR